MSTSSAKAVIEKWVGYLATGDMGDCRYLRR